MKRFKSYVLHLLNLWATRKPDPEPEQGEGEVEDIAKLEELLANERVKDQVRENLQNQEHGE